MNIDRIIYKKARNIFRYYLGRRGLMWHEGELKRYNLYHVPKKIEYKWRRELQHELKEQLLKEQSFLNITLVFSDYSIVSSDLKDDDAIDFMKQYILENKFLFDTQTLRICLENLMNVEWCLEQEEQKKELLLWVFAELQEAQKRKITISDEYLVDFDQKDNETPLELVERTLMNTLRECKNLLDKQGR